MELYIGGGCGEHGRNCFYIAADQTALIIDCGVKAGDDAPYPLLTDKQIRSAAYLFLTHSHNDHTGALAWLLAHGFTGHIVATAPTVQQIKTCLPRLTMIDRATAPLQPYQLSDTLTVSWGRSGHCVGSCWYQIKLEDKRLLCSGDYIADTLAYNCNVIQDQQADLAILDNAYGQRPQTSAQLRRAFIDSVTELLQQRNILLLPVPRYGRNLEILLALKHLFADYTFFADRHLLAELQKLAAYQTWLQPQAASQLAACPLQEVNLNSVPQPGIYLLSDPQLKKTANYPLLRKLIDAGGSILASGFIEPGSKTEQLCHEHLVRTNCYPVHTTAAALAAIIAANNFAKIVAFHAQDQPNPKQITF